MSLVFAAEVLFWISILLLFHNYLGLPASVWLISRFRIEPNKAEADLYSLPTVSVFIPAHNEEATIGEKIESVLRQNYPSDKIEIVVASDVSTDRTNEIVHDFEQNHVKLIDFRYRHGKLGAMDEVIPTLIGEVVVITDANVILGEGALQKLVSHYVDPKVGAVSGYQTVELPGHNTSLREERSYRNYEVALKRQLSHLGCLVGAFGGFYSIRRSCFRQIGPSPMGDDVLLPLEALAQGYVTRFEAGAVGNEAIGESQGEEYRRRIRMAAYNLNGLCRSLRLGWKAGILPLYVVFSYKVLRWVGPFIWAALILISLALCVVTPFHHWVAISVLIGIATALIGWIGEAVGVRLFPFRQTFYFASMNYASFPGVVRLFRGIKPFWTPRG